jgi:hypothetical protein
MHMASHGTLPDPKHVLSLRDFWRMTGLSLFPVLVTAVPAATLLIAVAIAGFFYGVDVAKLLHDPAAIAGINPLIGVVSNLGVLLWAAAAFVCLFSAALMRRRGPHDAFAFALCAGLLSAYLMLDDLFMFHENLVEHYIGMSEDGLYACLGVATLVFLFRFRAFILHSDFGYLLLALGFLATSVFIDTVVDYALPVFADKFPILEDIAEDGSKWIGIAFWACYYLRTCYQMIVEPERFAVLDQGGPSF